MVLYERGYGKDAAGIAMEAIHYARQQLFDVVLVDTAGRMQNNEPLMRALAKVRGGGGSRGGGMSQGAGRGGALLAMTSL